MKFQEDIQGPTLNSKKKKKNVNFIQFCFVSHWIKTDQIR